MSTNDPGDPNEGETPGPNFSGWEQTFSDPSQYNPHELHQNHRWVEDLTGDAHEETLGRALQEWGYLKPGETISDLQQAIQSVREQREDPFAQHRQAVEPPNAPGYPDPDDYSQDGTTMDPTILREVWQQDMREIQAEARREFEAQQAEQAAAFEIRRQLDEVANKNGFDARDREELMNRVNFKISQGGVMPHQIGSLVQDTYTEHQAYVDALIARKVAAGETQRGPSEGTNPPGGGAGVPPAPETQVSNARSLAARTMERIREIEGE